MDSFFQGNSSGSEIHLSNRRTDFKHSFIDQIPVPGKLTDEIRIYYPYRFSHLLVLIVN